MATTSPPKRSKQPRKTRDEWLRELVAWTLRHGRILWIIAVIVAIPATLRTADLYAHLRTELEELLPREAPSVVAIDELRGRMPSIQHLGVVVDFGKPENVGAAEKLLDDLAVRVRAYPPELVSDVRLGNQEEKAFIEKAAPLYVDLEDLREIRRRIEERRDSEVQRETGGSLEGDEGEASSAPLPPIDFSDIKKKYDDRISGAGNRFPTGRFTSIDKRVTLMLIEVGSFSTARGRSEELLKRVKADLAALGGPTHYAPEMRVGFTGDVAISVEELSALVSDLLFSSVLVVIAVTGAIVIYFRWWRSAIALLLPLLVATALAFTIASFPPFNVTALNSNTAFLGSIIVGNGINFGIVLLGRYAEERRNGRAAHDAMAEAVVNAREGTIAASLAAGVSYTALIVTEFRGFRQFGCIGGIGMVLSWLTAFILLPPLVVWLDRGSGTTTTAPPRHAIINAITHFVARWPRAIVFASGVLTIVAAMRVQHWDESELESDVSKLRRADTWVSGEGYWGRKMDDLLGAYLTPTVLLTNSQDEARKLEAALREEVKKPELGEMISQIRTIDDVVPPNQQAKIAEVEAIREDLTPRIMASLTPEQHDAVTRLLGGPDLKPITLDDLPRTFTLGLREAGDVVGRAVLVFPHQSSALWQGPPLAAFVGRLRAVATQTGAEPARVAGSLPLSADILGSVRRDGPLASVIAFAGVIGVVVLVFRRGRVSLWVIGSLLLGVLWMAGLSMALNIRINFANFIAYPITFGIGVDYAVNVMSRYVRDGWRDILAAVRTTGSAVALCSCTTIIGYSSLLMAQNRALYLFGLLAVLGEVCCLMAAIVVVPALLLRLRQTMGQSEWHRRRPPPAMPPRDIVRK